MQPLLRTAETTAIRENDRIELFNGEQPPMRTVIQTSTFTGKLERLAGALGTGTTRNRPSRG